LLAQKERTKEKGQPWKKCRESMLEAGGAKQAPEIQRLDSRTAIP
jgi:hypothetical protein